ncbi:DUF4349 domain-containing protein [Demequina sp.]|uniref:DUF4349 domain-containing protein n=1 Tax=Demequina sp. TaxID=2050685 RepID=UPI0025EEBD96|nr:DUF4349 domain-containing protein [Demequina sp.]
MGTRADATPHRFRRGVVIAAILALGWGLAGCTSGSSDSSGVAPGAPDAAYGEGGVAEAGGNDAAATDASTEDRSVIITGEMYMTVQDPIKAADQASGLVEVAGGRIDARRETAPTEYDGGSAYLTLRIPADDLDAVVDRLRELGTVDEYSTTSADVTREVTDLEAQISTLRASTARIESLLAEAEDISDIITLENELDSRQAQLESLEARQRGLDDQVSMSTIALSLTTEPVVIVDDAPQTFLGGLESGWNALTDFLTGALVVTGVLLPWLAAVALVGIVVLVAVRAARSRRARMTAASLPAPEAPREPAPAGEPAAGDGD